MTGKPCDVMCGNALPHSSWHLVDVQKNCVGPDARSLPLYARLEEVIGPDAPLLSFYARFTVSNERSYWIGRVFCPYEQSPWCLLC